MIDYSNINNTHDIINLVCNGEGEFLEVHNLRSYGPVLLNRDDNGEAKTAVIGGSVRTIVSSQCRKAAIRHNALNSRSERTRRAPERVACYMRSKYPDLKKEYLEGVMDIMVALLEPKKTDDNKKNETKNSKKKNNEKKNKYRMTSTVITVGNEDIKRFAAAIEKHCGLTGVPESNPELEKELKNLVDSCMLDYDVCLFGRMSTNQIVDTVDSASFFSFSFGVNENEGDNDYFVAQDIFDEQFSYFSKEIKAEIGKGSAHLNDRTINADTFYEYCGFSIPAYLENVMKGVDFENKNLVKERLRHAFDYFFEVLKLCVVQVPTAMQHQMCSVNKPVSYITLTRNAQNITYGDAFERKVVAVDDKSIMDVAVERFVEEANDDTFFYGEYLKKYWLNKKYKNEIDGAKSVTLVEMIDELRNYFYGEAGI